MSQPYTRSEIWSEFNSAVVEARAAVSAAQAKSLLSAEDEKRLQADALDGTLGKDMQVLAQAVRDGEDTWEAVFRGTSPRSALYFGHLETMIDTNAEAIRVALEEDDDVDFAGGGFEPGPPR